MGWECFPQSVVSLRNLVKVDFMDFPLGLTPLCWAFPVDALLTWMGNWMGYPVIPPAMEYPPSFRQNPHPWWMHPKICVRVSGIHPGLCASSWHRWVGKTTRSLLWSLSLKLRGRSELSSSLSRAQMVPLGVLGTGELGKELLPRNVCRDFGSQKGFGQRNEVNSGGG